MMENTSEIKNKIIETLKRNGPSLPIQISREIKTNTLFTSAFLSELVSEKKLKISKMKVGNSPIYFIYGQENLLQKFSNYLKNREKEAFDLLKEKKFVEDSEQEPVIRVALREIKDFAFPFYEKETKKLIWRFITNSEEDFYKERKNQISEKNIEEIKENFEEKKIKKDKKELDIFDENKKKLKQKKNFKKKNKKR